MVRRTSPDFLAHQMLEGHITRREFVLRASALGMSAALIGTYLSVSRTSARAQTESEPTEAVPDAAGLADEQVLRHGFAPELTHFDPAQEAGYARWIMPLVFTPLFHFSGDGNDPSEALPGTCLSFDVSEDGLVYTLHVDPAARWTDGTPVTAADLKAWMEYVSSPANPGPYRTTLEGVIGHPAVFEGGADDLEGVVAVDDTTLEMRLEDPNPLFVASVLFDYRLGGTKAEVARADPNAWWLNDPPSNGPFRIDNLDFDAAEYSFVASDSWWRTPPTLTRIEAFGGVDEQTLQIMFESGQVDSIFVFGEVAIQLETSMPETVEPMPGAGGMFFWALNVNKEPTDDIMVRRALRHAVDMEAVVDAVYQGERPVARGPILPNAPASRYDEIAELHDFFTYDPELAKSELAESRYGSAAQLPTLAITPNAESGDKVRATEIIVEMWRTNLGITDVDIRPDGDAFGEGEPSETVNVLRISGGGVPDAAHLLWNFAHSTSALPSRFMGGYEEPEIDELLEVAYYMDREDDAYVETVQQIEDQYLSDYTYIPLMIDQYSYFVQPWVQNLRANRHNVMYTLPNVYITPR